MQQHAFYNRRKLKTLVILRIFFWIFLLLLLVSTQNPFTLPLAFAVLFLLAATGHDLIRVLKWNKPQIVLREEGIEIFPRFGFARRIIPYNHITSFQVRRRPRRHAVGFLKYKNPSATFQTVHVIWLNEINEGDLLIEMVESKLSYPAAPNPVVHGVYKQ